MLRFLGDLNVNERKLGELGQIHKAAEHRTGRWNRYAQEFVTSFRRSDKMAHGTDAASARGERRHLAVRASFAELFKAAELS